MEILPKSFLGGEFAVIVKVGHHLLEAYPVENYVYEVSYCGRKEFYQDAWDAFRSTLSTKDSSYNATITKIPVRPISEKRIEERLLYQKSNSKDWDPSAVEEFKQSKLYPFRLCLRKIGLPLLIMLYVAIWIGLAIFK